jgi:hypothetical protein
MASCLVSPRVEAAGMFPGFAGRLAPLLARTNLVFVGFAERHLRILFGWKAPGAVTTEAPAGGTIAGGAGSRTGPIGPYLGTATVTLQSPQKSTPLCDEN